jgi:hypothetical protein
MCSSVVPDLFLSSVASIAGGDLDIGEVQIAMDDASVVGRFDRICDLPGDLDEHVSGRTLIATSCFSLESRALYTSPIPPAPSGLMISEAPANPGPSVIFLLMRSYAAAND